MDNQKEEMKNVLENGTYSMYGPESGDISFEKLELHAGTGAKRVWKVKSFSKDEIIFSVEKFG